MKTIIVIGEESEDFIVDCNFVEVLKDNITEDEYSIFCKCEYDGLFLVINDSEDSFDEVLKEEIPKEIKSEKLLKIVKSVIKEEISFLKEDGEYEETLKEEYWFQK